MGDSIRAVVVMPGKPAIVKEIGGSLKGLQQLVGGMIQAVNPYEDSASFICNEEGKILGLPPNRGLRNESGEVYDVIAGPFAVVGISGGDFVSLTPEQEARYLEMYKAPERFERRDGKVVAVPISGNMTIGDFREALIGHVQGLLSRDAIDATVEPCEVEKIQAGYMGITVQEKGKSVGISMDVAPAYETYRSAGIEAAVWRAYAAIKEGLKNSPGISVAQLGNYKWAMNHISAEVINRERNEDLLQTIPHTDLADLAVVYRIHLFDRRNDAATAVVTQDMLKTWKVSEEQFLADALIAAERNYPVHMTTMSNIFADLGGQSMSVPDVPMLVCMAGDIGRFGAGVIAYPDFAEKARTLMGGDFYILPSSRHEVILVPVECADVKDLETMVQSVNASDVLNKEDFLSDHVYKFDGESKTLALATAAQSNIREPIDIGIKKRGR